MLEDLVFTICGIEEVRLLELKKKEKKENNYFDFKVGAFSTFFQY